MLQKEGKSLTPLGSEYGVMIIPARTVMGTVSLWSLIFTKTPGTAVKDASLPGSFLVSVVYWVPPQEGSLCMEFVLWTLWPQGGGMPRPKPLSLIKSLSLMARTGTGSEERNSCFLTQARVTLSSGPKCLLYTWDGRCQYRQPRVEMGAACQEWRALRGAWRCLFHVTLTPHIIS